MMNDKFDTIDIADYENRKDGFNMNTEQSVEVTKAREIMNRRLEEGQHYGGIVKFAKCIIRENKHYLGNVRSFGVNEENDFLIDVAIDKDPDVLYTFSVPAELFVGSDLFFVFQELDIMNRSNEADLDALQGKRVSVVLARVSEGGLYIDRIAAARADEEESFTEEDFMQLEDCVE